MTALEHGRSAWLHHGCRCPTCRSAVRDYARMRRAELAVVDGRDPVVRVDAGTVRRRVAELRRAGWTLQRIADAAGVSFSTVSRVANRRLRRVALPTHRRLLAVRP